MQEIDNASPNSSQFLDAIEAGLPIDEQEEILADLLPDPAWWLSRDSENIDQPPF